MWSAAGPYIDTQARSYKTCPMAVKNTRDLFSSAVLTSYPSLLTMANWPTEWSQQCSVSIGITPVAILSSFLQYVYYSVLLLPHSTFLKHVRRPPTNPGISYSVPDCIKHFMRTAAEKQGAMSLACTLYAAVRHIFHYFYLPEGIPSCPLDWPLSRSPWNADTQLL